MAVSAAASPSAHVREKRRRRRAEILHAALRAFRDKGYHATTLENIADLLGVRKTALYHYFPDKETILYACHQEGLSEVHRHVDAAQAKHAAASARLAYLIREHVRVMTETLEGSTLAFEVSALAPAHQAEVIAARDRYEQVLRDTIAQGVADGEFRDVNPKVPVFAILGAINWIARWYRPEGSLHAPELGQQFAEHLIGGLTRR
ncbi:MAG: TetR/AcrR family transcriptional regulator [Gemmatimonadetes bacterium]|nr:TetR/AcrR family transcriptional regulator [Gemmatimonadota bacterium]